MKINKKYIIILIIIVLISYISTEYGKPPKTDAYYDVSLVRENGEYTEYLVSVEEDISNEDLEKIYYNVIYQDEKDLHMVTFINKDLKYTNNLGIATITEKEDKKIVIKRHY